MSEREFVMSPGQAHELDQSFVRCGWRPADVKRLSTGNTPSLVKLFMEGKFGFRHPLYLPPLDKVQDPEDRAVQHTTFPQGFDFDPEKLHLYQLSEQKDCAVNMGQLIDRLYTDKTVMPLNLQMRTYLMENKYFIPSDWKKGQRIFFLGSVNFNARAGNFRVYWARCARDRKNWNLGPFYMDSLEDFIPRPDDFVGCLKI